MGRTWAQIKNASKLGGFQNGMRTRARDAKMFAVNVFPPLKKKFNHTSKRSLANWIQTIPLANFASTSPFFFHLTMPTIAGSEKSECIETPRKRKLRSEEVSLLSEVTISTPKKLKSRRRIAVSNLRTPDKVKLFD